MDNLVDMVLKEHRYVTKRSGDKVIFESDKIKNAVLKAMESVGKIDVEMAEKIARLVKKSIFREDCSRP